MRTVPAIGCRGSLFVRVRCRPCLQSRQPGVVRTYMDLDMPAIHAPARYRGYACVDRRGRVLPDRGASPHLRRFGAPYPSPRPRGSSPYGELTGKSDLTRRQGRRVTICGVTPCSACPQPYSLRSSLRPRSGHLSRKMPSSRGCGIPSARVARSCVPVVDRRSTSDRTVGETKRAT